jgi:nicotinamidase-related amidase
VSGRSRAAVLGAGLLMLAACGSGAASSTASPAPAAVAGTAAPSIPAAVPVSVDRGSAALLLLDLTSVVCSPRRSCVSSLPAVAALLKKARDAGVPAVYSDTPTPGSTILDQVAPRPGDPKVSGRADKFFGTDLDQILKQRGVKTVVITGTVANGAVLYTAFGANLRGYTVVVAQDGISSDDPFAVLLARYQLLNQPGFTNPRNQPLKPDAVTLSRGELIQFR